ncbi:MAG: putative quinol monooxygenase, partial [Rikenellaceae bacterium]
MYFNKKTAEQLTLVARFKSIEGKAAQLQKELEALISPTRAEDGCVSYHLYRDRDDHNGFIFHEIWQSESIWLKHMQSAHLKSALANIAPILSEEPKIGKFERSDAPNPVSKKGMLVLFAYNYAKEGVEAPWQKI